LCLLAVGGVIVLASCEPAHRDTARSTRPRTATASDTGAPTTTTTTTTPPITYQVKRGDTLTAIARVVGVSTAALLAANQLPNGDRLTEGQVLVVPPQPPAQLTVTPPDALSGTALTLTVTSAKAGERVTFEIVAPDGSIFTGSPHTASQDGTVTTTYNTSGDDSGTYKVVATGDRGTSLQASFRLLG
jgi:LysM repeat protein